MTESSIDWTEIVEALTSANTIGVVGHVGPDGDALGSMIGLALAANRVGKTAVASFDVPFVMPEEMSYLDQSVLVAPAEFPTDLDVAVVVDTSVRSRVGSLAGALESAKTLVVIDHHISDGAWGDLTAIDVTAAATTELVYDLLRILGWSIDADVAAAIYTGIVTDTGRFQYSSTSPRTHEIASDLLSKGVVTDAIGQSLYEEAPFGYYEVVSRVLGRAVLDEPHGLVWSVMEPEDLESAGIAYHQTDGLIDLVRMARGTDVACLLKRKPGGTIKGSLRSRGKIDVAAIASSFGGGGHHNAAGFTSTADPETIIEQIAAFLS
ncbi:MAG: bifunctional oligoribonuclease/PAP phosphatase NrnA [Actinomycetota bacterium]